MAVSTSPGAAKYLLRYLVGWESHGEIPVRALRVKELGRCDGPSAQRDVDVLRWLDRQREDHLIPRNRGDGHHGEDQSGEIRSFRTRGSGSSGP